MDLTLLSLLAVAAAVASPVPNPRHVHSWISDTAHLIPEEARASVDARLDRLERDTGVEIAVVTLEDTSPKTPKQFATALFNEWGIGKRGVDNGVLVLLAKKRRRLEIETGNGLGSALPSDWLAGMERESMVPAFKRGQFGQGLEAGIVRLDDRLRAWYRGSKLDPAAPPQRPLVVERPRPSRGASLAAFMPSLPLFGFAHWPSVLFGGGGGIAALALLTRAVRRRVRRCKTCDVRMVLLSQEEMAPFLSAGQQAEKDLRSVSHYVFRCENCEAVKAFRYVRWFSGHSFCRGCGFHTTRRRSTTLTSATIGHDGLAEIEDTCAHCGDHSVYTRTLPRKTWADSKPSDRSSSSESSSSTSFGGGSSSGGGAGSDW